MTDLTRIEQRFRAINPVPDESNPPMPAKSITSTLLALEERKTEMQQLTRPTKKARNGPALRFAAAGALAMALAVIGAVVLLNNSSVEPADTATTAPATTVAPTTTQPGVTTTEADPAIEAEALGVAQAYQAAQTIDEQLAVVADDAVFTIAAYRFTGKDQIREWLQSMEAATVSFSDTRVDGNTVTWHTVVEWPDSGVEGGVPSNATAVIENGLIQSLTSR